MFSPFILFNALITSLSKLVHFLILDRVSFSDPSIGKCPWCMVQIQKYLGLSNVILLLSFSTPLFVRKTLKLNSLFFFIYFCPGEPEHNSKCSQTNCGNNISHACDYSIVYVPVHAHPRSMIKYSKIYVT